MYITYENNKIVHHIQIYISADTEPIFRCLATIIQNQHSSNFRIIFVSITLKLIRCCTNEVLTRGVILFFTSILHRYCEERWYLPLLLAMLKQMNTKEVNIL